ncbi:MAG TPA: DUF3231 family protein [Sporolactobacillaceae bacterium]|nr:DUF3231 family protein [Sporolactobacillaceae bacterium]
MKKIELTSSEFGTLWMTYQEKTMVQRILEYLVESADDPEAKKILHRAHKKVVGIVGEVSRLFENEGAINPIGYTEEDVNARAPKLYDHMFDILLLRLLSEIGMGLHTLHLNMSYRKDLIELYKSLTEFTQNTYEECMAYLEKNEAIARPPAVSPPRIVEFAKGTKYMSGLSPFTEKRSLNTVEVAHLYFAIESNIFGKQLMTGFAQVANEPECKQYFEEGKELAQRIVQTMSDVLIKSDIQVPATWAGTATDSKISPFSDKLMMYCTSLFCSFGLGTNAIGTAFSLRTDLPVKLLGITKDVFNYGQKGGRIMANNGWLEEPPQMEDRKDLIK